MALEIERRFLVRGEQWRAHSRWSQALRQGYLVAAAEGLTLRVRLAVPWIEPTPDRDLEIASEPDPEPERKTAGAWLTLKAPAGGISRHEFEYPIPLADAEALLALAPVALAKRRHGLDLPGGDWVLDVFEGANAPLVVAEVELTTPDQPITIPAWCVLEVTGRPELSNAALSRQPLASWPAEQRQPLLAALQPAR